MVRLRQRGRQDDDAAQGEGSSPATSRRRRHGRGRRLTPVALGGDRRGVGWQLGVEGDGELALGEASRGGLRPGASDLCDGGILRRERERMKAVAASEKNWHGGAYPWGWQQAQAAVVACGFELRVAMWHSDTTVS
jgi:hypothetical protein